MIDDFDRAQAADRPIYDAHDIVNDQQFEAIGAIRDVEDELGPMLMQGPLFRLSGNDGVIAHTGRAHGADTEEVLAELGFDEAAVSRLREEGAV